jgi:hypothetical protein
MSKTLTIVLLTLGMVAASAVLGQAPARLDLTHAVVVTPKQRGLVETNACRMLVEEVEKRSGVALAMATESPATGAVIYLGTRANLPAGMPDAPTAPAGDEGYVLLVAHDGGRVVVCAIGNTERGCVFAAGRLLREMWLTPGRVEAPEMNIATAPAMALRGHQIGYRTTANSYDFWDAKQFEQYVRDMVVWGTNAVELIPGPEDRMDRQPMSMNQQWAEIIHSYGMQVWFWYPLQERAASRVRTRGAGEPRTACPSRPDERRYILDRRRELFKRFKYLDAVFFPGGDPAGCPCDLCKPWVHTMLPLVEEIAAILRETHPNAQVWLSNQGFRDADNRWFYEQLQTQKPAWLTGLVYGPWAEESIEAMRAQAPVQYPIRQYPDICHAVRCQFPAREWDVVLAQTLGREPPSYRLHEEARIAGMFQKSSNGAVTYSDGISDDIHKMIWSAVLWDPKADPIEIARGYARYFLGGEFEEDGLAGLRGLEGAWTGSLLSNTDVPKTCEAWRQLEQRGGARLAKNWRFQMALLRGLYDRFIQLRLVSETTVEQQVLADLAADPDPAHAVGAAIAAIDKHQATQVAPEMKKRLLELGQAMYDTVGMQLRVDPWGAAGFERGAILDYLDARITNLAWMKSELEKLKRNSNAGAVRLGIERIVKWDDPGPGGFYDDLGNPARQPHLVQSRKWEDDPGYVQSTRCDFPYTNPGDGGRMSWISYAETLYGTPLILRYEGLDPKSRYAVRAVYAGRYKATMTLTANDTYRVHGPVKSPIAPKVMEWPVPMAATASGQLTLRWDRTEGRGAQVSEVWLIRR